MSHISETVTPGRYRHYKGKEYQVFGVARHSETGEQLVVYRCLYGDHSLWVRPLDMFAGFVIVGESRLPRFTRLPESLSPAQESGLNAEDIFAGTGFISMSGRGGNDG